MKYGPTRHRIWAVTALLAFAAYLYLAILVTLNGAFPIDRAVRDFFQAHQDASVGWIITGWAIFGDWQALTVLLIVLGLLFFRDVGKDYLLFFLFALGGGGAFGLLCKVVVGRLRPGDLRFGFPSGHTLAAMVVVSGLVYFAYRSRFVQRPLALAGIAGAGGLVVLGVGVSRMFTDSHWLTDVWGAILLGVAVSTGMVLAIERKGRQAAVSISRRESCISPQS